MSRGDEQRQRIIEALAVEISVNGYGGTKIQDIARGAKVSLRTFYAEFESKEACFLELYTLVTNALFDAIQASITFEDPWRVEMSKGFALHLAALEGAPRLTYAAMIEMAALSDDARNLRSAWLERVGTMMCEQIEKGRGVYTDVPSRSLTPLMARAILGGLTEMVIDLIISNEYERLPELIDVATELLWSAVTSGLDQSHLTAQVATQPTAN
ncbi:MAG: TetR/AcrR family transcriptional regulator [Solirubrobacteraceae bacterium]|nr:TetR/AcrR family transcriptional regulator [Solirubrobacteraceae bacterium]